MPSGLNAKKELRGAAKRLPRVFVIIGAIFLVVVAVVAVVVAVIAYQFVSNPAGEKAREIMAKPSSRAQVVLGLADCFATDNCPDGRNPTDDAARLVAPRSTINDSTFAEQSEDDWKRWGAAFMRYGHIPQESATTINRSTDHTSETVQVVTDHGQTMICDVKWTSDEKLVSWQCYADTPATTNSERPRR